MGYIGFSKSLGVRQRAELMRLARNYFRSGNTLPLSVLPIPLKQKHYLVSILRFTCYRITSSLSASNPPKTDGKWPNQKSLFWACSGYLNRKPTLMSTLEHGACIKLCCMPWTIEINQLEDATQRAWYDSRKPAEKSKGLVLVSFVFVELNIVLYQDETALPEAELAKKISTTIYHTATLPMMVLKILCHAYGGSIIWCWTMTSDQ